jgi:cyanophycinase
MPIVSPAAKLSQSTITIASLCLATFISNTSLANSGTWFDPDGFPGTLAIVGGGAIPDEVADILKAGLGDSGTVVVIPEASSNPVDAVESATEWLSEHGISSVEIVDLSLPAEERRLKAVAAIDAAAAVWICGGQQSRLVEAYAGSGIEGALQRLLQRGGVIAGTSAGAAIMSKVMIASGKEEPVIVQGWDLLPGAIVDQHFSERNRVGRSQIAVEKHRECFGLGIDEGTAVIVTGRRLRVAGYGGASVLLAKTEYRDAEVTRLVKGAVADLTQLRRAARQRASGIDPGLPKSGMPNVPTGSLVIVGGGAMPDDVVNRFIELAGGESAKIVVLPTAVPRAEATDQAPGFLKRGKVGSIKVLTQRGPGEIAAEEFQTAIQSATGIWFGGGRQWNFVDSYEGTEAVELFRDVLRRGGVIGGSSAGATIQGEFLVRGHPLGNTVMMAEGYERGFAFLPGTAIDQHFTQRGRLPDLLPVVQRHPQMLGIGIDEGTAIVVTGTSVDVIGQHSAHFVSAKQLKGVASDQPLPLTAEEAAKLYVSVKTGESLDLRQISE